MGGGGGGHTLRCMKGCSVKDFGIPASTQLPSFAENCFSLTNTTKLWAGGGVGKTEGREGGGGRGRAEGGTYVTLH